MSVESSSLSREMLGFELLSPPPSSPIIDLSYQFHLLGLESGARRESFRRSVGIYTSLIHVRLYPSLSPPTYS